MWQPRKWNYRIILSKIQNKLGLFFHFGLVNYSFQSHDTTNFFLVFLQCLVSIGVMQEQYDLMTGEVTLLFQLNFFFNLFEGAQNQGD